MSNNAEKLRTTDARIKGVLEAHLYEYLDSFNQGKSQDEKIPFPKIFVNIDMVSLENLNGVDEYPILSIYPSTTVTSLDIVSRQTIRTIWNVEAAIFSYSGAVDFTARKSSYLSNLASQCLETYLPSVGDPCIYDVQLRQTLGTKRMQMSGTTMRGWSSVSTIEVFQRFSYDFSPSKVSTEAYENPYLDNIPYFSGEVFKSNIVWNGIVEVPVLDTSTLLGILIDKNSEGTYPSQNIGNLILPDGTNESLTFYQNGIGQWVTTVFVPTPVPGDIYYLTNVANNIPKITTIKIIP